MSNYRRANFAGGYYFFTAVTYNRREIFVNSNARQCLRKAWRKTRDRHPFDVIAMCLLPEHIHCIWHLPESDCDFSTRWRLIKRYFTIGYIDSGGKELKQSNSRKCKGEKGIWQRRFWEHHIRDQRDLQNHVDYIHYNPLKHNLVKTLEDWPWSTYHKFVKQGFYKHRVLKDFDGNFGENFAE
ncbi:MAG: transposase [Phycisphaerae bacterium]|nr:transposase [Phycisphaerae bacterium]